MPLRESDKRGLEAQRRNAFAFGSENVAAAATLAALLNAARQALLIEGPREAPRTELQRGPKKISVPE